LTVSLFIGTGESVSTQTIATFVGEHPEPEVKKPAGPIIELTPLNRSQTILYNQLLAHAWNNIKTNPVHKVLKASPRGSHDSNDRLHEAFDRLKTHARKFKDKKPRTLSVRINRVYERPCDPAMGACGGHHILGSVRRDQEATASGAVAQRGAQ
jgi:hypothetical protein